MEMTVVNEDPEFTHVALSGRADLEGIGELADKFTEYIIDREKPALVDLSQVEYIASIGLRMLIMAAKPLGQHNAKMVLLNPQPNVEEALRTSAFHRIMPIEYDYDKALEAMRNTE